MLKCQSELFQPSLKLVDSLKMNTKEELKRMAKILTHYELTLLDKLVKAGGSIKKCCGRNN